MISFFIYISTLAYIPHYIIMLSILVLIYKNWNELVEVKLSSFRNNNIIIISLIVLFSIVNLIIGYNDTYKITSLFPYTILMFGSYFIAKYMSLRDIKLMVIFTIIESLIGFLEFFLHINTIFFKSTFFESYTSGNLMYFSKVFGLSENSSILAEKVLISIILIDYFSLFTKRNSFILKTILFITLYLTFQRTSILVIAIYYSFVYLLKLIKILNPIKLTIKENKIYKRIFFIFIIIFVVATILIVRNNLINQVTKGSGKIELSGREIIWDKFIKFIDNNLIFGNHSQKYFIDYVGGVHIHAHNSFLEVLASHGIIIFILFVLLIIININRYNYYFVGSLVLLSIFQYALFWGISINDIIFFIFALKKPNLYTLNINNISSR